MFWPIPGLISYDDWEMGRVYLFPKQTISNLTTLNKDVPPRSNEISCIKTRLEFCGHKLSFSCKLMPISDI